MPPKVRVTKKMILDTSFDIVRKEGHENLNARDRINLSVFSIFQWNSRIQICYFAYDYSTENICI